MASSFKHADMTFTPVSFQTSTASAIGAARDPRDLFIPGGIICFILTSALVWTVLPLVFQFYKQLFADDEISRLIVVLRVRRAVHHPVTSHKPTGEAGITTEEQPSPQRLTLDFNMAIANKGQLVTGWQGWLVAQESYLVLYSEMIAAPMLAPYCSTRLPAAQLSRQHRG